MWNTKVHKTAGEIPCWTGSSYLWFHIGLDPMAAKKGAIGIITRLWKVQCTHEPCPKDTMGGVWMAISGGAHIWRCPQCKIMKSISHGCFFQSLNCHCLIGNSLCSYGVGSTQSVMQLTMQIYLRRLQLTLINFFEMFALPNCFKPLSSLVVQA